MENDMEVGTFVEAFRERECLYGKTEIIDDWRLSVTFGGRLRGARWRFC